MPIRLIQTSDVHLDACFVPDALPPRTGNRLRESLRDVLAGILRRAAVWPADAVLIGGDLFEHSRVTHQTVAFLRHAFEQLAPIPVIISPGRHDPYVAGSPYASDEWPPNVWIYSEPTWRSFEFGDIPLTVHGVAVQEPHTQSGPIGAPSLPEDDRVHLILAHADAAGTAEEGAEDEDSPIATGFRDAFNPEALRSQGFTYVALGGRHVYTPIEHAGRLCACYSGAPEGHGFNEPGIYYYAEVTIQDDGTSGGRNVVANPVRSCRTVYCSHSLDCTGFPSLEQVIDGIRALPLEEAEAQILRVTLTGTLPGAVSSQIPSIQSTLAGDFAYIQVLDASCPEEDYEELTRANTSLGAFLRKINAEIADATEMRQPLLMRARAVGLAAYRGNTLPVPDEDTV